MGLGGWVDGGAGGGVGCVRACVRACALVCVGRWWVHYSTLVMSGGGAYFKYTGSTIMLIMRCSLQQYTCSIIRQAHIGCSTTIRLITRSSPVIHW